MMFGMVLQEVFYLENSESAVDYCNKNNISHKIDEKDGINIGSQSPAALQSMKEAGLKYTKK